MYNTLCLFFFCTNCSILRNLPDSQLRMTHFAQPLHFKPLFFLVLSMLQGQQEPSERDEADRGVAVAAGGAGAAAAGGATASPGKQSVGGERKAKKESKDKDKCVIL